jgi:hypothetical protein
MTKNRSKSRVWIKPEITKLGALRDVSGPRGVGTEGGPNGKS